MELTENLGEIAADGDPLNSLPISNNLNILHFNAQSLVPRENNTKFDEVKSLMENSGIDAFGVTETWYKDYLSDEVVEIPGYKVFRMDRVVGRGGGVCLYIRNNIRTRTVFNPRHNNIEIILVEMLMANDEIVLLGVIYLPNGQFAHCEQVLDDLSSRYNNIVIMGDFNTNLFQSANDVREICSRLSLSIVHNSLPTHFSPQHQSSSLIDYFLVSNMEMVARKCQFQIPALNSYHAAIFLSYKIRKVLDTNIFTYRDYKQLDIDNCISQINNIDFSSIYNESNVDRCVEHFNYIINSAFNDNVPLRRFKQRSENGWMQEDCICNAKRLRNLAYRALKENRTEENFRTYCTLRNKLKTIIRKTRRRYCINYFSNCNQRQLWQKIKSVGVLNSKASEGLPIDVDEFNEFCNMPNTAYENNIYNEFEGGFSFNSVSAGEVYEAMSKIKSHAVGTDNIDIRFLKIIFPAVSGHFTYIINKVLTTCKVPKIWKVGRVVPIPKVRNPSLLSDFRPISVLSVCSKVLEMIIKEQMLFHLNSNNLIHNYQSGYRNGYSTTGLLLDVTESIRRQYDKGEISLMIFLDFSKAFDSISHGLLIKKLRLQFGFGFNSCKLIYSFLSERSQFVQSGSHISNVIQIRRGVPQGSILGPLLFTLYLNDLYNELAFLSAYTYADDVQLCASFKPSTLQIAQSRINEELARIVVWSNTNCLKLNPIKCKAMIFSKTPIALEIVLENEVVEIVSKFKTLGIILDDKLTFDSHVNFVISRVSWTLRKLYSTAYYLPLAIRRRVALSLCLPLFLYGLEIFSCTSESNLHRLKTCFNRILRYIYRLGIRDHVSEYCLDLLGSSFEQYVQLRSMIFFYKTVKFGNPPYLLNRFNFATSNRTYALVYPIHTSLLMARSYSVRICRLWNTVVPYNERRFSHSLKKFANIFISHL